MKEARQPPKAVQLRPTRPRYHLGPRRFEQLVWEALANLPPAFAERLTNVAVVVKEAPSPAQLAEQDGEAGDTLLGLYEGVPLDQRASNYHLAVPDRITIFRRPILASCRTYAEIKAEVRATVMHEIAHFFGIGDEELD